MAYFEIHQTMLTALPLISFILFWVCSYRLNRSERSLRHAFLTACLLTGSCITIGTEFLSLCSALSFTPLALFWVAVITSTFITMMFFKKNVPFPNPGESTPVNTINKLLFFLTTAIILAAGITAFVAPPNNWDSMTYHMSRVAHWIQNKSVAFYPTSMPRQLWASPWSEYTICHLQILSQSDRFANLVQWFCMLASVIACSLIAQLLGARKRGQLITAAICASIPVGILEASSTQNDYAAAIWCLCAIYFGIQLKQTFSKKAVLWFSLSLGLALSTKTTSAIFLFPFLIWFFCATALKQTKNIGFVLISTFLIVFAFNAPQYLRNYQLDGNPLTLKSESKTVTNEQYRPQAVFSTALRYLGLNLCTSNQQLNQFIADSIKRIHTAVGLNVIDTRFTIGEAYQIRQDIHEDNSCNTAYTILFIIMSVVYLFRRKIIYSPDIKIYFFALACALTLFFLLVKWQPWGNRLLLPMVILSVPFLGTVLDKNYPRFQIVITFILVLLCLPWIVHNRSRPLLNKEFTIFNRDRDKQYFSNIPGEYYSYQKAAQEIQQSGCKDVALIMSIDSWEYPLWLYLGHPKNTNVRFEHVNVINPSGKFKYPRGDFNPCLVVHETAKGIPNVSINGVNFVKTNQYTFLSIFRKDPDGSLARSVSASYVQQMLRLAVESEQVLQSALQRGGIDQNTMRESFRLRTLSMDYADLLDIDQLNKNYDGLGTAVRDLYMKGTRQLLDGIAAQDAAKINEGQSLLNEWQKWFNRNYSATQKQ